MFLKARLFSSVAFENIRGEREGGSISELYSDVLVSMELRNYGRTEQRSKAFP